MNKVRTIIAVIMLVGALAAAGCGPAESPAPGGTDSTITLKNNPDARPVVGSPAPDFVLESTAGQAISLGSLAGRPVLLNFWATWCGPCKEEIPYLQDLSRDRDWLDRGLEVVAVDIQEGRQEVQEFMKEFGMTYRVLLDGSGEVAGLYNIRGIPTTVFIDKVGIIRYIKIGTFTGKQEIESILEQTIMEDITGS
jgi:cytochrome c biogenesis protein CcmG/thiol:disulfide interchange protein DsbE